MDSKKPENKTGAMFHGNQHVNEQGQAHKSGSEKAMGSCAKPTGTCQGDAKASGQKMSGQAEKSSHK